MYVTAAITPLHRAVINGSLSEMKSLLENGTSTDIHEKQVIKGSLNGEVLRVAECFNSLRTIDIGPYEFSRFMRNDGLLVIRNDTGTLGYLEEGMTPIFLTVILNFKPGFELLLEKGACVNKRDVYRNSPLHYAARSGNFVKELLDSGADFDNMNVNNQTPIYYAISGKCEEALRLLLERGARIDTEDIFSCPPLHFAVRKGFIYGVELLLENGIEVNVTNQMKRTPLISSAIMGSSQMFQLLLGKGAALNSRDFNGKSAEEYNPYVLCWLEELKRLETVKFGCWSLYDVFSLPNRRDPVMITNVEMAATIHSPSFETEFPFYAPCLKKYFCQAEERYKMMNEAQEYFSHFLPKEIRRMIMSFLSSEDLINYIRANVGDN